MRQAIILVIVLVLCSTLYSQLTYDWNWASGAGGSSGDSGKAIATDDAGNIFVTGMYERTAQFGSSSLTDDGSHPYDPNIFVAKMDSLGNWLWAKNAICHDYFSLWVEAIAIDAYGNCIIVGQYNGAASVGTQIVSNGGMDGFIAKLDTNGNWLWAKTFGGTGNDAALGVSTDGDGNIFVTGNFSGTVIVNTNLLISAGNYDIFAVKMDSNGDWVWAKRAGGTESDYGYAIATDNNGNSFITGSFRLSASFGSAYISSYGSADIFVANIDSYGNWVWANNAGSVNGDEGASITCDNLGNSFLIGKIGGNASFGPSILDFYGNTDVFVAKLDINGNWLWAIQAGSNDGDTGNSIVIDDDGNSFVSGRFQGTLHYGTSTITSIGYSDMFVARIDTNGNWIFMSQVGSAGGASISMDCFDRLVVTGGFANSVDFGMHNLISSGSYDVFVAKLSQKSPTASFFSDVTDGLEPLQIQFTDNSSVGWGTITDWYWDFGDGNYSTEQNPIHTYASDGVYSVSLEITNSFSLSDTLIIADYIHVLPRNPEIAFMPSSAMDFGIVNLTTQSTMDLLIRNIGTATVSLDSIYILLADTRYEVLGLTMPYEIAENDSVVVHISFTPLIEGIYSDSLIIYNNSINLPRAAIRLSGIGQYVPPMPPENVAILMDGSNAVISWDAVSETVLHTPLIPDYYLVFHNGSGDIDDDYYYLGWTESLSYTHQRVGLHAQNMFYRVLAYKYYGRGSEDIASLGLEPGMKEDEVLLRLRR